MLYLLCLGKTRHFLVKEGGGLFVYIGVASLLFFKVNSIYFCYYATSLYIVNGL